MSVSQGSAGGSSIGSVSFVPGSNGGGAVGVGVGVGVGTGNPHGPTTLGSCALFSIPRRSSATRLRRLGAGACTAHAVMDFCSKLVILDAMTDVSASALAWRVRPAADFKGPSSAGAAVARWTISCGFAADEAEASAVGTELVRCAGLVPIQKVDTAAMAFLPARDRFYAHYGLCTREQFGLNVLVRGGFPGTARGCFEILCELTKEFKEVVENVVIRNGHEVVYGRIRGLQAWARILLLVAELQECEIEVDVKEEVKKACLYNLYNIMIIHGKLAYGHPKDIRTRGSFFNTAAYVIAGVRLNSTELEHGVLRCKMRNDHPLVALRLEQRDPRMHFILNCGAQSCPPIVVVPTQGTDKVLEEATRRFIAQNCDIDDAKRTVILSRLWKWFRGDFTPGRTSDDRELINWIAIRAPENIAKMLDYLQHDGRARPPKISFMKYNWADNGDWTVEPDTNFMALYDFSFRREA